MKKSLSFVLTFAMLASMTYTPALGAEKPEDIVPKADTQVVSHAISPLEYGTPKSESETFAAYRDFIQERLGEETKTDRYIIKPLPGTTADTLSRLGGTAVVSWDTFQSGKVSQNTYAVITLAEKMDPDIYESRVGAGVAFIQPDHPLAKILSLEQLPKTMLLSADGDMEELPGFTEYRYWAQVLHADGTITEEIISVFVEWE